MANETIKLQVMQEMSSLINELCSQDIGILADLIDGFPVSTVKIDEMFRSRIETRDRNRKIMKMIEQLVMEA
ncbi:MAG TPA: hypothetical protein VFM18_13785 [Methanosarcina sp.]|nr:hypothetical protein [Methanosarcina sp.]